MAGAHGTEPIKLGVLMDYAMPNSDIRDDFVQPIELVFKDGLESGMIDRPVELVHREVDGLPRGTVNAVIDAFGELVDEGCLAVIGPNISDNAVAVREEIERRFRVPAISVCGSEDWLGEWTFLLNNGSMTDEPILWAHLMAKAGQKTAGMLVERSYIGQSYLLNFRRAAQHEGIQIVAEEYIAQTGQDIAAAVRTLHDAGAEAIVHCGFGLGVAEINDALARARLGPAPVHGDRFGDGLRRTHLGRVRGLDRPRAVRRGQPRRDGVPRPVRSRVRAAPGVLQPGAVVRRGHVVPPRLRRRHAALAARCPGRARAGEDAARGVRVRRDAHLLREVEPPRLDGSGLPRRALPRPERQGGGEAVEVHPGGSVRPGLKVTG